MTDPERAVLAAVGALGRRGVLPCTGREVAVHMADDAPERFHLYAILEQLETDGLLSARWESVKLAHQEGRSPRRFYWLAEDPE